MLVMSVSLTFYYKTAASDRIKSVIFICYFFKYEKQMSSADVALQSSYSLGSFY